MEGTKPRFTHRKLNPVSALFPVARHVMWCHLFWSHRHFLFKQSSGSSALLSGAGQGYPLTSGTVYSPPPRPLPRSSVTRPLFTFNKPHRCCNWKCTALSASLLTLTLALLLTYVIGESSRHVVQNWWKKKENETFFFFACICLRIWPLKKKGFCGGRKRFRGGEGGRGGRGGGGSGGVQRTPN